MTSETPLELATRMAREGASREEISTTLQAHNLSPDDIALLFGTLPPGLRSSPPLLPRWTTAETVHVLSCLLPALLPTGVWVLGEIERVFAPEHFRGDAIPLSILALMLAAPLTLGFSVLAVVFAVQSSRHPMRALRRATTAALVIDATLGPLAFVKMGGMMMIAALLGFRST